ncbi:substrate-binding domain-containing protein [Aliiroseovarius sediminis]|uniref:ABC transporter substrate-binding protein n=1 Tax=Aliiroseovarius sediminis TaxID=2925839 RepID=UPI001F5A8B7B|nr:substrate-binding domain-containing protein [Aliiroseovarius sediminis]MCI2395686.1 substrate-binding domain-containing protein [Aliiroseovarius sediminis]
MCFADISARVMVALVALTLMTSSALGFEVESRKLYQAKSERSRLKVISTADLNVFDPIIRAFQDAHSGITVDYTVTGTTDLMGALYDEGAVFDLAISSAMDLQTKLANDGFAQDHAPQIATTLPAWATWRDQLFAFTQEPAILVVSDEFFAEGTAPQNRDELIAVLRDNPDRFQGKIGTYDVRRSGFGYLMATQDSRNSDAFWRLMEVMGRLDAKLYCCSGDMIRDVASGKLALAYNVLGSYAAAQLKHTNGFQIIEMSDYVNVMSRTALIPRTAENVDDARMMLDFLLDLKARKDLVAASGLPAVDAAALRTNPSLRPVRYGPALLVFLDNLKRQSFLRNWENSLLQN